VTTPTVALELAGAAAVAIEPGWVSPGYGVRHPAPVVVGSVRQAAGARLVTLLAPRGAADPPRMQLVDVDAGEVVVTLADGSVDTICWRPPHLQAVLARRDRLRAAPERGAGP
jgi:hypothetical protein